ncbi:MAG TPA: hypothetical protein VKF39_05350, partial [Nitrososphaerales archaeon]|nr:hypothetical protein [Nitrososphaerales archaeon]
LAQIEAANPAFAQFVPQLQSAFSQSVNPLFFAGLGFSLAAVVASLFVQGSFRQQLVARDALHASEDAGTLQEVTRPPPGIVQQQGIAKAEVQGQTES